ncbi:hypothetical protein P4O66_009005 [Electrophorus voltai]|uniref:Di19 zinc-binding domain-containing protein n=1 Tax=Electrophorus voltai TaxID=2609070 RepID=A0AAD8ZAV6_9TELE|nr:hypothetical protein P4O66_009005 [Electrophorus voltai]
MDSAMTENECPVCKDTIKTPSEPTPCCKKVLLNQLREDHLLALSSTLNDGLNQASPEPGAQACSPAPTAPQRRPTPIPRVNISQNVVTPTNTPPPLPVPVAPVQRLLPPAANHTPLITPHASDDEIPPSVRTFHCPYCQQGGLDDLDLRDHCNANHLTDARYVVCPVCVSLPHGNQEYHSRDFIGHLNLRHCYYIEDVTNIYQSDDINMQAAILMSLSQAH